MNYLKLSKEVSYALRHAPWEYELELDENGWVEIEQLIDSFKLSVEWQKIDKNSLCAMIEKSDKKRHEISCGKIRALYGHSVPKKILKEPKKPPKVLYHGTTKRFIQSIKKKGLTPQKRQYVHLSINTQTALKVGKRHDNEPILLVIHALEAWHKGIKFYFGNDKVWLADFVPSKYIDFE